MKKKNDSRCRLLLFTLEFYPYRGGVAAYNDNLIRGLAELGNRVDVLTSSIPGREKEEENTDRSLARTKRIAVYRKNLWPRGKLLQWFFIMSAHIFLIGRPDIVLVTDDAGQRIASMMNLSWFRIPYYVTVHGSEVYSTFSREMSAGGIDRKLFSLFKHRAEVFYLKAEGIIFVSCYTRDLFKIFLKKPLKKHEVVHNGIDEGIVLSERDVRRRMEAKRGKVVCITVSRIDPRKNHETVLKALALLSDSVRRGILYKILGSGEYRSKLEACIRSMGLENQVIFMGEVSEKKKLDELDAADIFIMPSRQVRGTVEGLGISFLEAGARGLPLIGGRHGGVPEVIRDGANGFLVDPDDSAGIARVLERLNENPSLREEMGWNSWRRVKNHFLRKRMVNETMDFIFRNGK